MSTDTKTEKFPVTPQVQPEKGCETETTNDETHSIGLTFAAMMDGRLSQTEWDLMVRVY